MMQKRRNASISGIMVIVGSIVTVWSTFLPALELSGAHVTLGPIGLDASQHISVGETQAAAPVRSCAVAIAVLGALLLITRRRGWRILWRFGVLGLLAIPVSVCAAVSYALSDPGVVLTDRSFPFMTKLFAFGASAHVDAIDGEPGLWLLAFGTVLMLIGLLVPSFKSHRFIIDGNDPRLGGRAAWDY